MFGFEKGKIEVVLEKYNFKPGETIKGKLKLKMKKPTKAKQLRVMFAGVKSSSSSGVNVFGSSSSDSRKGKTQYIHKFEMPLDGEKEYTEGEYDFEIAIPADVLQRGSGPGGTLGTAMQAASFLTGTSTRIEWFVQASLDIEKSLDVNKKVQVNIA